MNKPYASFKWTSDNVRKFFNKLRQTPMGESDFARTAGPRLAELMSDLIGEAPAKILDFGSGGAVLPLALAGKGYTVTGYDPSLGKSELNSYTTNPVLCNEFPSGKFDAVIVSEVVEHLLDEELDACFNRWNMALNAGGRLIITTPYKENLKTSLCLCPNCHQTFHRWQHQRSITVPWLESMLSKFGAWEKKHVGLYDFSSDRDIITAIKRYERYRPSMTAQIQTMIDSTPSDENADMAEHIAERLHDLLFSGYLNDHGFDYAEGYRNILVYVAEKKRVSKKVKSS